MICTFFGHRLVPDKIEPTLRSTLIDLIEYHNVITFYIGNHGDFDKKVRCVINNLSRKYPIKYYVVLAYMPKKKSETDIADYSNTLLPEGIETVPKRFAINYRNKWMIERSNYVVTYVDHSAGSGAAQFKEYAMKKGKTVIELSEYL